MRKPGIPKDGDDLAIKKLCKNTDITDAETIKPWIYECVLKHKKRHDFEKLLRNHGMTKAEYREAVDTGNVNLFDTAIDGIARIATDMIIQRDLSALPKPTIRTRMDITTGKIREIGCESALQQIFDIIAVKGSMDVLMRRIKPQQISSIKGRGQIYGVRMIKGWVRKDNAHLEYAERHGFRAQSKMKYFVKCDIQKCYQNMRVKPFMERFSADCGNEDLIWLWGTLLKSHVVDDDHQGFMIGALTSQWAAQYVISFAYEYVTNLVLPGRRGKRRNLVSHMCIFMDDILMTSGTRKNLVKATRLLSVYMQNEFGLTIKPNWEVKEFAKQGIDMMGYVVYRSGKVALRARNFVHSRRMAIRAVARKNLSYKQATRIMSYKGLYDHTDSLKAKSLYMLPAVWNKSRKVISLCESRRTKKDGSGTLQRETGSNQIYAAPGQ